MSGDYFIEFRPAFVEDWPDAHTVWFKVGAQQFQIGAHPMETLEEARWLAGQFQNAIAKLVQGGT